MLGLGFGATLQIGCSALAVAAIVAIIRMSP